VQRQKQNKSYTAYTENEYAFGRRMRGKYEKEIEVELELMFSELPEVTAL
jgi:hypothetical protein